MRIVVMGAGAIGGYAGARMAAAGADVLFVARGPHGAALREHGLTVHSDLGDLRLPDVSTTANPAGHEPADVVLFTVKGQDTATAMDAMAPLVGPQTAIISFQNGVEGLDLLIVRYGAERVLGGISYLPAFIEAPGVIRHVGKVSRYIFGELDGRLSQRALAFRDLAVAAGLDMVLVEDTLVQIWSKFVLLAPFSAIACLTRLPLGRWIAVPETRDLYRRGMEEVVAVAMARGVALPVDIVMRNMAFAVETQDPSARGSMLEDLERGKPIEVDSLSGAVHRMGLGLGIPTPINSTAWAALKAYAG